MGFTMIYLPSGNLNITTEIGPLIWFDDRFKRWPSSIAMLNYKYQMDPHGHMAYLNLQIELENMVKSCKIVDRDEWLSIARSLEAGG